MMINLADHTHKKLKAKQIQDLPKSFKLGLKDSVTSYVTDWAMAFAFIHIMSLMFAISISEFIPGFQSKFKIWSAFTGDEIVGVFFIPTLFLYNFFSLFLDSKTYGMNRSKVTYTFKKYDYKSAFYWSMARVFNFSSLGIFSSFLNTWAMNRTQHQMSSHDFLYQDLTAEKAPVNLLHLVHNETAEEFVDEKIAA